MGAPFDVAAFRSCQHMPATAISQSLENEFGPTRTYSPANAGKVVERCPNIRWAVENQDKVSEPYWHDGPIGVGKFCGDETVHKWSREHPNYNPDETQAKSDNWKGTGATLCTTLEQHNPEACARCEHRGKIKSPIALGYHDASHDGGVTIEPMLALEVGMLVLSKLPPPRRLWAIEKLIPLGKYVILAGLGGVSKTMLAIVWVLHVVLGKPWAGLNVAEGAAMLLLGEEDAEEIINRVGAVCREMPDEDRSKVMKRLLAFPWAGKDMRLTALYDGNPMETRMVSEIIKVANLQAERCGHPVRLIVIDHARLAIGGDPNDAQHVTEVTRVLTKIANATGAAVVLIAHSPKAAIGKLKNGDDADAADVAGSIAWVDNSRAAMVLTTMREDEAKKFGIDKDSRHKYAKLHLVKANYAATGWECWLHRMAIPDWGVSIPTVATLTPPAKQIRDASLDARIIDLVKKMPGQLSIKKLRETYAGKKRHLEAAEGDVELALQKLIEDGRIRHRAPTSDERQEYGLSHQTKTVLEAVE